MATSLHVPIPQGIREAAWACRETLEECLKVEMLTKDEWAETRLADFNIWAASVGAFAKPLASLDGRLIRQPAARNVVASLLLALKAFAEECIDMGKPDDQLSLGSRRANDTSGLRKEAGQVVPLQGEVCPSKTEDEGLDAANLLNPRSVSPWSDESSSEPESEKPKPSSCPLTVAMGRTEAHLDQLIRLGAALRKSGTASRLQKADATFNPADHNDLKEHLNLLLLTRPMRNSIPSNISPAELTPSQRLLINANLRRRNRFTYAKRHAKKLAAFDNVGLEVPAVTYVKVSGREEEGTMELSEATSAEQANLLVETSKPAATVLTDTTASALEPAVKEELLKLPTPSQQASTRLSVTATKLEYPNPPPRTGTMNTFICPCCFQALPITHMERRRWRYVLCCGQF